MEPEYNLDLSKSEDLVTYLNLTIATKNKVLMETETKLNQADNLVSSLITQVQRLKTQERRMKRELGESQDLISRMRTDIKRLSPRSNKNQSGPPNLVGSICAKQ